MALSSHLPPCDLIAARRPSSASKRRPRGRAVALLPAIEPSPSASARPRRLRTRLRRYEPPRARATPPALSWWPRGACDDERTPPPRALLRPRDGQPRRVP